MFYDGEEERGKAICQGKRVSIRPKKIMPAWNMEPCMHAKPKSHTHPSTCTIISRTIKMYPKEMIQFYII